MRGWRGGSRVAFLAWPVFAAGLRVLGRILRHRDLTTRMVHDAVEGSGLERKQAC